MRTLSAIFQIKLTLAGVTPPIVRRLQMSDATTLPQLHRLIQAAMNWENHHLHDFVINGRTYAEPHPEDFDRETYDERRVRLSKVLKNVGTQFEYRYDYGDGWEHDLLLEAILIPEEGVHYPRCIEAKRNAPPEDCGGPHGYMEYVEALNDRMHERHRELRDWRGPFDAEYVSVDLLNERLQVAAKSSRPVPLEPVLASPYARLKSRGRAMEVELSERERDLIVNHSFADEELIRDMRPGVKGAARKFRFSWDELDDLASFVAAEANAARNRKLQQEWSRMYEKFTAVLDSKAGRA